MNKTTAFIWKESVYKNAFTCECGNELADPETGTPKDSLLVDENKEVIYCDKCIKPVCYYQDIETDLEPGLHGNFLEVMGGGSKHGI